ncbi:MAG: FadR family transcriptional regulator [Anaerolineae bacterium]|nr:FadR family transcriptional regulator [Anaerolineae bacterium]
MLIRSNGTELRKKRAGLHQQVVDELGRFITRETQPGYTLPNEDDLCAQLGVSRTVIREAIKVLAEKGMVESRPKVGTVVQPTKHWNLLDTDVLRWKYESGPDRDFLHKIVEFRRTIEVKAAELAALRATPEAVAYIEACFEVLVAAVNDNDKYIETDMRFHESIFAASRNDFLEQIAMTLRLALISSRKITVQIPNSSQHALPLHEAVLQAIKDHNPVAARDWTNALIDQAERDIDVILQHTHKG